MTYFKSIDLEDVEVIFTWSETVESVCEAEGVTATSDTTLTFSHTVASRTTDPLPLYQWVIANALDRDGNVCQRIIESAVHSEMGMRYEATFMAWATKCIGEYAAAMMLEKTELEFNNEQTGTMLIGLGAELANNARGAAFLLEQSILDGADSRMKGLVTLDKAKAAFEVCCKNRFALACSVLLVSALDQRRREHKGPTPAQALKLAALSKMVDQHELNAQIVAEAPKNVPELIRDALRKKVMGHSDVILAILAGRPGELHGHAAGSG